ncbi:hypothetical protein [Streptomyces sp. NBC_00078]|nr:hypothetical protein [Streptomyces sp. NBC_00078]MCX5423742.1 hypothetical protein [Streptomyces sp. NBC_00078]
MLVSPVSPFGPPWTGGGRRAAPSAPASGIGGPQAGPADRTAAPS